MKKIILDGNYMKTKEKTHRYLKEKLNICGYYGNNLDALWDVISVYSEPISIKFINENRLIEYLGDYGNDLISLFREAEDENPNISFRIKYLF